MTTMQAWVTAVARELDVPEPDVQAVLALTRDVAHAVDRPAAPLTAWLVGAAVARGLEPDAAMERVRTLLREWTS